MLFRVPRELNTLVSRALNRVGEGALYFLFRVDDSMAQRWEEFCPRMSVSAIREPAAINAGLK